MTGFVVTLQAPDSKVFAPFGRFIMPPATVGSRAHYSDALTTHPAESDLVMHVNHVRPSRLPLTATRIERHPHAAQCFIPLDVARYVVVVMPTDAEDKPDPSAAVGFLVPPTVGVIYNPGVWHLGATVLDRPGHFTVLMWRDGTEADDEFVTTPPLTLTEPKVPAAAHF